MVNNKAHVTLILDKSGSMSSVREKTISGVNEYFQTLKNDTATDYTVDLVLFDNKTTNLYSNAKLEDVKPLTSESYVPNDGTALYDAACATLLNREAGEPVKWIVVIITDGEENASSKYNEKQFADFVKLLKGTGLVQFVYLGANQDAFAQASKWNFTPGNVTNFQATSRGMGQAFTTSAMNTVSSANADWSAMSASGGAGGSNGGSFFSSTQQNNLQNGGGTAAPSGNTPPDTN